MPIITISRGTFSGGQQLAQMLAREMGCPCVSREVIAEAAHQYGVSQADLAAALQRAPRLLERLRRDRDRYLAFIRAVLCQHAERGDFVYHGHGGHHVLAAIKHVVRVRVVADITFRVRAAMDREHMTSKQAEAYIVKVDEERRRWTRFLYGVQWDDPSNYDVVLNLEHLEIPGACAAVLAIAKLEQFKATEQSLRAVGNLALGSLVAAALAKDERTRDGEFRVRADGGVVTVEGVVGLARMAESVTSVASAVTGVREVVSQVVTAGLSV